MQVFALGAKPHIFCTKYWEMSVEHIWTCFAVCIMQSLSIFLFDKLKSGNPWEEHFFSRMKLLIKSSEASPFTRLKTLRVQYPRDPPSLPYEVIRYFFESSSSTGEKSVKFEKIK